MLLRSMLEIKRLEFDSELFGYNVGITTLQGNEKEVLNRNCREMYKLVYVISRVELDQKLVEEKQLKLADIKTVWKKSFDLKVIDDLYGIDEFKGDEEITLRELALLSGVYSRFNTDPEFQSGEYVKLYSVWIDRIIKRELADVILVYKEDTAILGFVSAQMVNGIAKIGLIAVAESARGRAVATRLMKGIENWAIQNGSEALIVATQSANLPAMALYEKNGYTISDREYIYHLWH